MDLRDSPESVLKAVREIVDQNNDLYAEAEREKYNVELDEAAYQKWKVTIDMGGDKKFPDTRKTVETRARNQKEAEKTAMKVFAKKYNAGSTSGLKVSNVETA